MGVWGLAPASSKASRSRGSVGGPQARRYTHKAVHTKDGLWPPQESCYLRVVRGLAPVSSEASPKQGVCIRVGVTFRVLV